MREDIYNTLQKIAHDAMHNTYAGLYTMLRSDESFPSRIERNYRLKSFDENHDFYLTASEKQIHLMGFIDAIIWLERSGYFGNHSVEADEDDEEPQEPETEHEQKRAIEAAKEQEAINNLIICFETGEDW